MKTLSILALAGLPLFVTACGHHGWSGASKSDPSVSRVDFSLETSTNDLLVGETATVFARSYDTYGRDPQLVWTTTAGKLTTEQNGRVARIMFDQPGTFFVTAVLTADGREIKRQSVEIRVKPLS